VSAEKIAFLDRQHFGDKIRVQFPLRLSPSILERIGRTAKERDIKIPINTWITEAILAQLKKEGL